VEVVLAMVALDGAAGEMEVAAAETEVAEVAAEEEEMVGVDVKSDEGMKKEYARYEIWVWV
jgi:hypothetical protein